ncbi:MAG: PAS domain S-box protein [Deltaproteobacteria bacterium]|nr:PAS domain S-box protein [Deltaproteobacteria bacterium]
MKKNNIKEMLILKNAVENTNEAFVTIDENHTVIFFNKAAEKMFGYSKAEVIGRDLNSILSQGCSQNHRNAVDLYVKTGKPKRIGHETEMTVSRKNGDTFPAAISFSVTDIGGRLFFTGIVRDLTEKNALIEKAIRSERMASLGQLVAEITHEIKNPLMVIGGFAQQLRRSIEDEKNLHKLDIITREVKRLENLLSDVREFHLSKTMTSERVDLKELLREIYSMLQEDCERQDIQIKMKIHEKAIFVAGDSNRLKQVFLNLIKNSMESMEHGGMIKVETKVSGGFAEITIKDEGCGISEEDKERIFSPFYTTKSHGTGLGLSISKRIIEDHLNSSLTMDSKEGRGTSFKVTLPVYQETQ